MNAISLGLTAFLILIHFINVQDKQILCFLKHLETSVLLTVLRFLSRSFP